MNSAVLFGGLAFYRLSDAAGMHSLCFKALNNLDESFEKYCLNIYLLFFQLNYCILKIVYFRCRPMESDTAETEKLQETNEDVSFFSRFFSFVPSDGLNGLEQQFVASQF